MRFVCERAVGLRRENARVEGRRLTKGFVRRRRGTVCVIVAGGTGLCQCVGVRGLGDALYGKFGERRHRCQDDTEGVHPSWSFRAART
jgi:hypothetical protein